MFLPLKVYDHVLSGWSCVIILVFANGKIKKTSKQLLTEQELNTKVLNIFAIDKNVFKIYLTKLYKKEESK